MWAHSSRLQQCRTGGALLGRACRGGASALLRASHGGKSHRELAVHCSHNSAGRFQAASIWTTNTRGSQPKPPLYHCPACLQPFRNLAKLTVHLGKCCADLLAGESGLVAENAHTMLDRLKAKEALLRKRVIGAMYADNNTSLSESTRLSNAAATLALCPDRIATVAKTARKMIPLHASSAEVEIMYQDDDLLAVNKPGGTTTTPAHRHTGDSLLNRLIGRLGYEPLPVHRLDMETTGVVLFAKNKRTASELQKQFSQKSIDKVYVAIVVGNPEDSFSVDAKIARHPTNKFMRCTSEAGQPATTNFRTLERGGIPADSLIWSEYALDNVQVAPRPEAALVQCTPLTGRTHQIRLHLAHAGCPILGDDLYGPVMPLMPRQALHASRLTFWHPGQRRLLTFTAPLPADMERVLARLQLRPRSAA